MALKTCRECGGSVSSTARWCPHCGYQESSTWRIAWLVLASVGTVIGLLISFGGLMSAGWSTGILLSIGVVTLLFFYAGSR